MSAAVEVVRTEAAPVAADKRQVFVSSFDGPHELGPRNFPSDVDFDAWYDSRRRDAIRQNTRALRRDAARRYYANRNRG